MHRYVLHCARITRDADLLHGLDQRDFFTSENVYLFEMKAVDALAVEIVHDRSRHRVLDFKTSFAVKEVEIAVC